MSVKHLKESDNFSVEMTLSNMVCLPPEKGSTLKGKNVPPLGANSFLLEQTPFQKEFDVHESNQEVINVVSLANYCRKSTKCIQSP